MENASKVLLWLHLMGLAFGVAGGFGLGQIGPRLAAGGPAAATLGPLVKPFQMAARGGLAVMLLTGPALVFAKYGGFAELGLMFHIKMALVVLFVILVGFSEWGGARSRRGDPGGAKVSAVSGPLTFLTVIAIVLVAVWAFG